LIEAELKARVADLDALKERLSRRATGENSTYQDTYYDRPGCELTSEGRELRVRVVDTGGVRRALITYKEPEVDTASASKPEHETEVADASVADIILRALGLEQLVSFEKHCVNYRFTAKGRNMLATVVTVPEVDGTFVELETLAAKPDLGTALADVRAVLRELGISDDDLTTEQYTDAVMRSRH
jgi:adenylate cyclase class 2